MNLAGTRQTILILCVLHTPALLAAEEVFSYVTPPSAIALAPGEKKSESIWSYITAGTDDHDLQGLRFTSVGKTGNELDSLSDATEWMFSYHILYGENSSSEQLLSNLSFGVRNNYIIANDETNNLYWGVGPFVEFGETTVRETDDIISILGYGVDLEIGFVKKIHLGGIAISPYVSYLFDWQSRNYESDTNFADTVNEEKSINEHFAILGLVADFSFARLGFQYNTGDNKLMMISLAYFTD